MKNFARPLLAIEYLIENPFKEIHVDYYAGNIFLRYSDILQEIQFKNNIKNNTTSQNTWRKLTLSLNETVKYFKCIRKVGEEKDVTSLRGKFLKPNKHITKNRFLKVINRLIELEYDTELINYEDCKYNLKLCIDDIGRVVWYDGHIDNDNQILLKNFLN